MKILTIVIGIILLCSLSTINAANNTINETSTGGIRQGIANTGIGDTLFLQPGTYNKTGDDTKISINKNITIQGNGSPEKIIIDGKSLNRIFSISTNTNVSFINITFINGNIIDDGGVIYNPYSNSIVKIVSCSFINNTASNRGGVIYNVGTGLTVVNSNFINNTAGTYGGVIRNSGSNTNIMGCIFTNNKVYNNNGYGGAIYNTGDNFTINDSKFNDNNSTYMGGAIYNNKVNFLVKNSEFTNNSATADGGSIWDNSGNLTIINCNYTNNKASSGGAIYYYGENLTINSSNFKNNIAYYGASIYNLGNYFILDSSNFAANNAILYGTIATSGFNFTCINNNFVNNKAYDGGAIYGIHHYCIIKNSSFIGNNATNSGGAIYNDQLCVNWVIHGSEFIDNVADYGAGIFNNGNMIITGNFMIGNNATNSGGAIFNNGTIGVLNLTFMGNRTIYPGSNVVTIFARLIDDRGNPITGQNISFYINGVFITNVTAVEGIANFTYTFIPEGEHLISGTYDGNGNYDINIFDGIIAFKSDISSDLSLNKDNIKVNESVTGKVTVTNNGNLKESDLKVVVKLPKDFVLDNIPSGAVYDENLNTLTWILDTIDPSKSVVFEFTGYFTRSGNYTFNSDVFNNNVFISNLADIEVIKNDTPTPNPNPTPTPVPNPTPINETNKTSNNPISKAAVMKPTGIPIITIILILLSSLGLIVRKK